mmetsp:Transcript_23741/g.71225  ORF Transcript_23741/g.71225 Transcript_23741/m.71225 type:complete len:207 (+) Transcript_23741:431-1051(+)
MSMGAHHMPNSSETTFSASVRAASLRHTNCAEPSPPQPMDLPPQQSSLSRGWRSTRWSVGAANCSMHSGAPNLSKSAMAASMSSPSLWPSPARSASSASPTRARFAAPSHACTPLPTSSVGGPGKLRCSDRSINGVSFGRPRSTTMRGIRLPTATGSTSRSSPSYVMSTGWLPKAQAWSMRPQFEGVATSPRYAYSISPRVDRRSP